MPMSFDEIFQMVSAQQAQESGKKAACEQFIADPFPVVTESGVDLTPYVTRLILANGVWTEPNINRATLYLSSGREEAKAVGQEVYDLYGFGMMQTLHEFMKENFIPRIGNGLSAAWNRVGEWED